LSNRETKQRSKWIRQDWNPREYLGEELEGQGTDQDRTGGGETQDCKAPDNAKNVARIYRQAALRQLVWQNPQSAACPSGRDLFPTFSVLGDALGRMKDRPGTCNQELNIWWECLVVGVSRKWQGKLLCRKDRNVRQSSTRQGSSGPGELLASKT
jgi:hypothetical protein